MHICILRVINLSNLAIWFLAKQMFFFYFQCVIKPLFSMFVIKYAVRFLKLSDPVRNIEIYC